MNRLDKHTLSYSFKATIPVMTGYLALGTGFGVLLQSNGYSFIWAILMSLFIYAGSMQFVAISLLTGGASLISAAVMTLMVNIRHFFYGITMLEPYKIAKKEKPYLIFALTDETFSLVCSPVIPKDINKRKYFFYVSLLNQIYWISGSIIGGLLGNLITFNTKGIDFSMTALFTVIFIDQWEKAKSHIPAITGVIVTLICRLIFGCDNFLIPSMFAFSLILLLLKKLIKGGDLHE